MEKSMSLIKLYGPGIPFALRILEHFKAELVTGKNSEFLSKISQAHPYIGEEADYEFVWKNVPETLDILSLIEILDEKIAESEAKYSITTKVPEEDILIYNFDSPKVKGVAYTFFRIHGPSLSKAINILNKEITNKIPGIQLSKGILLGKYDYVIEWLRIPTVSDIIGLLERIDSVLKDTGVTYNVTTKSKLKLHTDPLDKKQEKQIMEIGAPSPSFTIETGSENNK
ncbi:hypothetical protein CEE45_12865 [Candidatus Heimdallarchaeota archaeon B3_Heim]|nr:MAG: hypothetical protein CEE45_12865 [Candidatus Heimdallarchaeota archaeon B3_Heim]